jgi:hypothetical protein
VKADNADRKRVEARLMGFDSSRSAAWQRICARFGDSLSQSELLSLAEVISSEVGLKVDREAKRRKEVLIKWFDENYPAIEDLLDRLRLEDANGRPITGKA